MAKIQKWYGKTEEEVKVMDFDQFLALIPTRARRSLKRGYNQQKKQLLEKVSVDKKNIKTHCRNMVITPAMLGKTIKIYNGKEWVMLVVTLEMLGYFLGEFAETRKKVTHGSAGLGATRSSKSVSAK